MYRFGNFLLGLSLFTVSLMWFYSEKNYEALTSVILSISYLVASSISLAKVLKNILSLRNLEYIDKLKYIFPILFLIPVFLFAMVEKEDIKYFDCGLSDSIHKAAYRGDLTYVKKCIGAGVDVNILEKNNWTPLHSASKGGNIMIVKFLLEHGANVNAKDKYGRSPLDHTFNDEVISLLKSKGGIRLR